MDAATKWGETAIGCISDCKVDKDASAVTKLLLRWGAKVNLNDGQALSSAVEAKESGVIRILLDAGAAVNKPDETPVLIDAAQTAQLDVMKMLLKRGANVNIVNKSGETALEHVCDQKDGDAAAEAKLLLHYGAQINAHNGAALSKAVRNCSASVVNILIDAGANVNVMTHKEDKEPGSLLLCAVNKHDSKIVRLLLKAGANSNEPALIGSILKRAKIICSDVKGSEDSEQCNCADKTPAEVKVESLKIVRILTEFGAK